MSDPRKRFNSDAERQTERRVRNLMRGFNTQGKPYQRHPNFVNQAEANRNTVEHQLRLRRKNKLAKNLDRYQRIAKENRARGLRVDGRPFRRKRNVRVDGRPFRRKRNVRVEWQSFRSEIKIAPVSFEDFGAVTRAGIYA